jgi:hypothetical protein
MLDIGLFCILFIDRYNDRRIQALERKVKDLEDRRDAQIRAEICRANGTTDFSDPDVIRIMELLEEIVADKEAVGK